jgi:hypothetical protein
MIEVARFHDQLCDGITPTICRLIDMNVPRDKITQQINTVDGKVWWLLYVDLNQEEWDALVKKQSCILGHSYHEECDTCSKRMNDIIMRCPRD